MTPPCRISALRHKGFSSGAAPTPDAAADLSDRSEGVPDDAAALIAFLLSRDAAYITGQTIHVDGGLTLA